MIEPYPLVCEPILLPKPWGGDRLGRFGKRVASGERIGESWELVDMASTSSSSTGPGGGVGSGIAGSGATGSTIVNGALAGKSVRDAVALWGARLMGRVGLTREGGFPLLIKLLDAREHLSVQVHPSPAFARAHPEAHLKTECWLILDAAADSRIFKGVKPGVTRETFERALSQGDGAGVVELMESVAAVIGECHNLPSGTVHALGAGVLVAEVQTPSDTTFRVYDWGRLENGTPRRLHIRESLECIQWEQARDATKLMAGQARTTLVTTGYFDVEHLRGPGGTARSKMGGGDDYRSAMLRPGATTRFPLVGTPHAGGDERPVVVMVVKGRGGVGGGGGGVGAALRWGTHADGAMMVALGQTVVVPACLTREATIELGDEDEVLLAIPRS